MICGAELSCAGRAGVFEGKSAEGNRDAASVEDLDEVIREWRAAVSAAAVNLADYQSGRRCVESGGKCAEEKKCNCSRDPGTDGLGHKCEIVPVRMAGYQVVFS